MRKNVASQIVGAQLVSASDGSAFTGSVTVAVTIDGGTQATGTVGSGACTHEGNGYHTYTPSQAETNGDLVAFTFTGTGAVPVTVQIYTTPTTGVLDAAGVRAAVGLASANLDTQLADLPTVAEFEARSLPSADYFVVGDYTVPDNANILLIRQILGNKHNVTDNGNGTFTIVVRNDADDATVRTLIYNPTTGARTVS